VTDLFDYEKAARRHDPATSKEAAQRAHDLAARHHAAIMGALNASAAPLAAEQIGDKIGIDHVAVNRRLTELERAEMIERTHERHKNRSGRSAVKYRPRALSQIATIMNAG
jgi:predicted ArsR family transcriptional regulator